MQKNRIERKIESKHRMNSDRETKQQFSEIEIYYSATKYKMNYGR